MLPECKGWDQLMSFMAKIRWILLLVAVTPIFFCAIAGWRAALLSIGTFMGMMRGHPT